MSNFQSDSYSEIDNLKSSPLAKKGTILIFTLIVVKNMLVCLALLNAVRLVDININVNVSTQPCFEDSSESWGLMSSQFGAKRALAVHTSK